MFCLISFFVARCGGNNSWLTSAKTVMQNVYVHTHVDAHSLWSTAGRPFWSQRAAVVIDSCFYRLWLVHLRRLLYSLTEADTNTHKSCRCTHTQAPFLLYIIDATPLLVLKIVIHLKWRHSVWSAEEFPPLPSPGQRLRVPHNVPVKKTWSPLKLGSLRSL